jgi:bacillolysin
MMPKNYLWLMRVIMFGLCLNWIKVSGFAQSIEDLEIRLVGELSNTVRQSGALATSAPLIDSDPSLSSVMRALTKARGEITSNAGSVDRSNHLSTSREAMARLRRAASNQVEIYLRNDFTVRHIDGEGLGSIRKSNQRLSTAGGLLARVREFLRDYKDLFVLSDPDNELELDRRQDEDDGAVDFRFVQRYQGLNVWPASLVIHLNQEGNLNGVDGAYAPSPNLTNLVPKIAPVEAISKARAHKSGDSGSSNSAPELIVYAPIETVARLAWKFDLSFGFTQAWRFVIDAENGRILHRSALVADGGVVGSGSDQKNIRRALNIWQQGSKYYLIDTSKPMFVAGSDPLSNPPGVIYVADARGTSKDKLGNDTIFNITASSPDAWAVPAGVGAAYNFSQTYDYYLERHNRNSLDGQGGNITAIVDVGGYDNASWNGNLGMMLFGDARPYAASLDVIGHELTHGVTEKTAGLIYQLQSGALNEAFSDIMGEMVEARTRGVNDWMIGSDLAAPIRNLKNPGSMVIQGLNRPYPSKMSEFIDLPNTDGADYGGVHLNSSIINHCYYELVEGLPGSIGRKDAERIFYRTLTGYLQAQSQFIDCRLGAISAAKAIFGNDSAQARATAAAFDAVEIFAAPTSPDPSPVPVVNASDSTLFLYQDFFGLSLGRLETAQHDSSGGSAFADGVAQERPAVSGDGSLALFVSADFDLCLAPTSNPNSQKCLGYPGKAHSVALSPDGNYVAFVLRDPVSGNPTSGISVGNLTTGTIKTFALVSPALDGVSVNQVLYADAIAFSTDSRQLYYDAVSQVQFAEGPKVQRWSIYSLDFNSGVTAIVVPPISGIDSGNPALGRAGTRYLAFDAQVQSSGNSAVVVLDQFTGQASFVATVVGGLGYPVFVGDESAVIYSGPSASSSSSNTSLFKQKLDATRLKSVGNPTLWLEDAVLGVVYRRGNFVGSNALPVVSLVAPSPVPAPASIELAATASDPDGNVIRVEFFNGAEKLGESLTPDRGAYRFTWTGIGSGSYRLIARATDNSGGSSDSAAVSVTVTPSNIATPQLKAVPLSTGGIRLSLHGDPGNYVISQSDNLRTWDDVIPVTLGASGVWSVDYSSVPTVNGSLFYRARPQ